MKHLYTSLFLLLALVGYGQSGSIKGKVVEFENNLPMQNVAVVIVGSLLGTTTDAKGEYLITELKPGTYQIQFKFVGYSTYTKVVELKDNSVQVVDAKMTLDIKELLAVEIRDDKIKNHAYSKVVIKEAQIEQRPVRDVGDYLREIPNLYAVRKGGANLDPVIRGFKFSQLNVQVDNGLRMEGGCPNRMDPTTSHVEAGDIEAIEVYKGPFALRYGEVMGGVVNMITPGPKPFEKFQIHGKANIGYESNWDGWRQHFALYGGNKRVYFSLTTNNSTYGNYTDGDGNTVPSHFSKYGYNAKLGVALAKNHEVIFSYSDFYAKNLAFAALSMDERADFTKQYSVDYKGKNISNIIESIDIKGYYTSIDHTMDNKERGISDTSIAVAQIDAIRYGYRAEAGLNFDSKGHLFVGTDMYQINKDGDRVKTMIGQYPTNGKVPVKIENLWNNAQMSNFGFFGEYRYHLDLWEFVGAARLDMNHAQSDSISLLSSTNSELIGIDADSTISNYTNVSANIGVTRQISDQLSLGMTFGRGVRSPDMLERFIILLPTGFDNYEYLGNPNLKPEVNHELDFVVKYHNPKLGALEFTAFYSIIKDYIGGTFVAPAVQKPLTNTVLGVKEFNNIGTANLFGFELGLATPEQYPWKVSASLAYTQGTLNEAEVMKFDATGKVTGFDIVKNDPLGEIPPMNFNMTLSYKLLHGKVIPKLHFRHSMNQNRVSASMEELTTPSFSLLNFSLAYKHSSYFTLVLGADNLLDTPYYEHLNRRVLGTNTRLYEPGRVVYVNMIFNL